MIRLIQIACIVVTVAILFAFRQAFYAFGNLFEGPGFGWGFGGGIFFTIAVYLFICWIDPSSRPRGTAGQQQRFDDRVN
jgi:amino acid transporter